MFTKRTEITRYTFTVEEMFDMVIDHLYGLEVDTSKFRYQSEKKLDLTNAYNDRPEIVITDDDHDKFTFEFTLTEEDD